MAWALRFEGRTDREKFKELSGGLVPGIIGISMTWINVLEIAGPPASPEQLAMAGRPGWIPAQLVAHTLFYFTHEGDLVFDPMAGGGVVADTCLAFNRKCWSFHLVDRLKTHPEVEVFRWSPESLLWPVKGKEKPDLIFFDPPYFSKLADQYTKDSTSTLSRKGYLGFFREFLPLAKERSKTKARIGFLNADWPPARRLPAPLPARRAYRPASGS